MRRIPWRKQSIFCGGTEKMNPKSSLNKIVLITAVAILLWSEKVYRQWSSFWPLSVQSKKGYIRSCRYQHFPRRVRCSSPEVLGGFTRKQPLAFSRRQPLGELRVRWSQPPPATIAISISLSAFTFSRFFIVMISFFSFFILASWAELCFSCLRAQYNTTSITELSHKKMIVRQHPGLR